MQNIEIFPPILETPRLILRPLEDRDAADVYEYAGNPENTKYVLFDAHKSIYDSINFIGGMKIKYQNRACYDYAIVLKESGKVIGTGGVFDSGGLPHNACLGYIINKRYWGRGLAIEAMSAVIRFLTEALYTHRIEACHIVENEASGRVMQKLGMRYEGTHIDELFLRGRYWTIKRYAMINDGNSYE